MDDNWKWPEGRKQNAKVKRIIEAMAENLIPKTNQADQLQWVPNSTSAFTLASDVQVVRGDQNMEGWSRLLWRKNVVPRFGFILWLLCQRPLNTKDRLIAWGMRVDAVYLLCGECNETIDHLFFLCLVSKEVWKICQTKCSIFRGEYGWRDEIEWLKVYYVREDFPGQERRLSFAAVVYHVWRARNGMYFQGKIRGSKEIFEAIMNDVRKKTEVCRGVKRNLENWNLATE